MNKAKIFIIIILLQSLSVYSVRETAEEGAITDTWQDTLKIKALIKTVNGLIPKEPDKALSYCNKALSMSEQLNYTFGIISALNLKADCYIKKNNYVEAITCLNRSLQIATNAGNKPAVFYALNVLGASYGDLYNFPKSLEYFLKALRVSEEMNDKQRESRALCNIGVFYLESKNEKSAKFYFDKALLIEEKLKDKTGIAILYENIGKLYYNNFEYSNAFKYYNEALKIYREKNMEQDIGSVLASIGDIYCAQKEYEKALDYYMQSMEIGEKYKEQRMVGLALHGIGNIYKETGNYKEALKYMKNSLDVSLNTKDKMQTSKLYFKMSEIYEIIRDINNAYENYKLFHRYNDSIFNEDNNNKITQLQANYMIEKKENQLVTLKQKNKINKLKNYIMGIGLISILVMGLFIFYNLRLKIKKKQVEVKISQIKEIQLKDSLKYKSSELTNLGTHIAEKNKFLKDLLNYLNNTKITSKDKTVLQYNETIVKLINQNLSIEKDQQEFITHIEQINQDFYCKLQEKFPDMTKNEKRLSALIKLGLSYKEIATLMNIDPRSVNVARYRLRKKFNLQSEDDLYKFLNGIG